MRYIVVYKESVPYNVSGASVSHRPCPSVRRKSLCTVYCVLCSVYGISPQFKWPYVSGEGEGEAKLVYKAYLANKPRYQLCDWK